MKLLDYEPIPYVDLRKLTNSEWLAFRRTGIGASDAPIIFEQSQYKSILDLFWDKSEREDKEILLKRVEERLNQEQATPYMEQSEWGDLIIDPNEEFNLSAEIGNALEPVIGKYLSCKFKILVYKPHFMYQHPHYPFMLVTLDFVAMWPDEESGELIPIVVQAKSATFYKMDDWNEGPPENYVTQVRHEMCVMNWKKAILICFLDNNEGGVRIYMVNRDYVVESKIVQAEKQYWENHQLPGILPIPSVGNDAAVKSIAKLHQLKSYQKPVQLFTPELVKLAREYEKIYTHVKQEQEKLAGLKMRLSVKMIGEEKAECENLRLKWVTRAGSKKTDYEALNLLAPSVYSNCVRHSTPTTFFQIDVKEAKANSNLTEAA